MKKIILLPLGILLIGAIIGTFFIWKKVQNNKKEPEVQIMPTPVEGYKDWTLTIDALISLPNTTRKITFTGKIPESAEANNTDEGIKIQNPNLTFSLTIDPESQNYFSFVKEDKKLSDVKLTDKEIYRIPAGNTWSYSDKLSTYNENECAPSFSPVPQGIPTYCIAASININLGATYSTNLYANCEVIESRKGHEDDCDKIFSTLDLALEN